MYCLTKAQTDVQFLVSKYLTAGSRSQQKISLVLVVEAKAAIKVNMQIFNYLFC